MGPKVFNRTECVPESLRARARVPQKLMGSMGCLASALGFCTDTVGVASLMRIKEHVHVERVWPSG